MEERTVVKLISQYLHEHGFTASLKSLQTERCFFRASSSCFMKHDVHSGRNFHADDLETKCLQDILGEWLVGVLASGST